MSATVCLKANHFWQKITLQCHSFILYDTILVGFLISFVYFQWNPLSFYFSCRSDKLYKQFSYRIHVENEMSEKSLTSTTTCIMTRKNQRRIPSKRSEIKVVGYANLYINVWCIGKHRALRRNGTCNFKLYLEIGKCLSQFKALHINVETTIVYTQIYTKVTAQCPLSTYSCSFGIDIWKLKLPHHKACSSLPIMQIVAIELANCEPVFSHLRILTDLCQSKVRYEYYAEPWFNN